MRGSVGAEYDTPVLDTAFSALPASIESTPDKMPEDIMQRPTLVQALKRSYLMIAKNAQHIATRGIAIADAIGANVFIPV